MSNPIVEMIQAMPDAERRGAIVLLDKLTRPLTPREIEHALRERGASKKQAVYLAGALKSLHIVAMVGGEHG